MKYQRIQFCITHNDKVDDNTIRTSEQMCKDDFVNSSPFLPDWDKAENYGYSCVEIKILIELTNNDKE